MIDDLEMEHEIPPVTYPEPSPVTNV